MACKGAKLLLPAFEEYKGQKGVWSMQTNPKYYRNAEKITEQAVHFSTLAPNIQVKIPVTKAGIEAIEEATYQGVNIKCHRKALRCRRQSRWQRRWNAELDRRKAEGRGTEGMTPVCTIMVGRTDDWIKDVGKASGELIDPECYEWAGVAVAKKAYRIYQERKYHTRLLFRALRNHYHWSEFIGGDLVLTIAYGWQKKINSSRIAVGNRIDNPVRQEYVDTLYELIRRFPQSIR